MDGSCFTVSVPLTLRRRRGGTGRIPKHFVDRIQGAFRLVTPGEKETNKRSHRDIGLTGIFRSLPDETLAITIKFDTECREAAVVS